MSWPHSLHCGGAIRKISNVRISDGMFECHRASERGAVLVCVCVCVCVSVSEQSHDRSHELVGFEKIPAMIFCVVDKKNQLTAVISGLSTTKVNEFTWRHNSVVSYVAAADGIAQF